MDKTEDQIHVKSSNANAESASFESAQTTLQPPALQLKSNDSSGDQQEVEQVVEQPYQLAAEDSTPPVDSPDGRSIGTDSGSPNNGPLPPRSKTNGTSSIVPATTASDWAPAMSSEEITSLHLQLESKFHSLRRLSRSNRSSESPGTSN